MKNCTQCNETFETTDIDRAFYNKATIEAGGRTFPIPEPTFCPDCRQRRRMAFYNRRSLYKRKCDATGKDIVSIFSQDKPFKVYDKSFWYGDKWDPLEFGREYDFNRPFFEQFRKHMETVPLLSLMLLGQNENSDYNNDNMNLKNCYLTFDGTGGEDSMYGETFIYVKDSMDYLGLEHSELCYECVTCVKCYNLKYSRFCKGCYDSWFLRDCSECKNCFGCANLTQKQYYIFNEQKTKEEYQTFMKEFDSSDYEVIQGMKKKIEAFYLNKPVRYIHGIHNENIIGDNLNHCKNALYCFDSNYLQDCEYVTDSQQGAKDSWDIDVYGEAMELCYEGVVVGTNVRKVMWCYLVNEGAENVYYSIFCSRNVKNLFACIGLRQKSYCVLNKQYSEGEYADLVPKIIEHMQSTGEWGQYFPTEKSAFGYNETVAMDYYPMEREDVIAKGWQWRDKPDTLSNITKTIPAHRLPDKIHNIPDDILSWAITCQETGRLFQIQPKELKFYRQHHLPVPHVHPDARHRHRVTLRNPHHLWKRNCDKCRAEIETTYAPERKEIVYCETCYQQAVR